jgi:hypothetical protein
MRRLSQKSSTLISREIQDPASSATVHWILNQMDPESALAKVISENVRQATDAVSSASSGSLDRNFPQKLSTFYRNICARIGKRSQGIRKKPSTLVVPSALGQGIFDQLSQAFKLATAGTCLPPTPWDAHAPTTPFLDMLRSLTTDPATLATGMDLRQKEMNFRAVGSDNDLNPVLASQQVLIQKLQNDKYAACKGALPQPTGDAAVDVPAANAAKQQAVQQVQADINAAAASAAATLQLEATNPAAAMAKAAADAAVAATAKAASDAQTQAMQQATAVYVAERTGAPMPGSIYRTNPDGTPSSTIDWNAELLSHPQYSMSDLDILAWQQSRIDRGYAGLVSRDEYEYLSNQHLTNDIHGADAFNTFKQINPNQTFEQGQFGSTAAVVKVAEKVVSYIPVVGQAISAALNIALAAQQKSQAASVAAAKAAQAQAVAAQNAAAAQAALPTSGPVYDFSNVISQGTVQIPNAPAVFRLDVEGRTVQDGAVSLGVISQIAYQTTKVGDRFEIFQNGQSIGLWVRSANGPIAVPANQVANVKAMSPTDVMNLLANASANAGGSSGGSGLLLLLAIPAVALAASKKGR